MASLRRGLADVETSLIRDVRHQAVACHAMACLSDAGECRGRGDPAEGNLGRLCVPAFGYCGGKTVAFF